MMSSWQGTENNNKIRRTGAGARTYHRDQESSFLSSLDDNLDGILIITGDNIKLGDIKNTSDNRNEFQEYSDRPN